MADVPRAQFSYRDDRDVPAFDETKTLFVFDGVCVMCSRWARWLMWYDRRDRLRFVAAQSPLGQALYRHYAIEMDKTYLLIDQGRAYTASDGILRLCRVLGGVLRLGLIGRLIPRRLRDAGYALLARNRYRWFGKVDYCGLLSEDQRRRLL